LERIQFAQAVLSQSIEPESGADKKSLVEALDILKKEDPTFTWGVDKDTGQTLMSGMGTLHLEIKRHRMERDFRLKVRVGKPRVGYRETVKGRTRGEGEMVRHAPSPGGAGMFAKITVELEPYKGPEAVVVFNQLGEEFQHEWVMAAEAGVRGALDSGEMG